MEVKHGNYLISLVWKPGIGRRFRTGWATSSARGATKHTFTETDVEIDYVKRKKIKCQDTRY